MLVSAFYLQVKTASQFGRTTSSHESCPSLHIFVPEFCIHILYPHAWSVIPDSQTFVSNKIKYIAEKASFLYCILLRHILLDLVTLIILHEWYKL